MNLSVLPQFAGSSALNQLPVPIVYPAALALRQMATLMQRGEKAARGPGRAPSGVVPHRLVPLSDPQYVAKLEVMVGSLKIPLEHRNPETGRTEKVRILSGVGPQLVR